MEILLASNNKNKHKELLKIFQEFGSKHTLIVNKDIPNVIEDKNTIEENAKKKAEECYEIFKSPIISDDSGLFVDALDGQPGVHSKRYAGLSSTDVENNQKLINELKTTKPAPNKVNTFGISPQIVKPKKIAKTKLKYFIGVTKDASARR